MTIPSHTMPFTVILNDLTENNVLQCEQLLRGLPGKRAAYKASWQERPVLIKLFLDAKSAHRHWAREKSGVEALKAASIATPELLYAGALDDKTPVLVFDFLPDAQTSLEVWNRLATPNLRADLLRQMVELVSRLHDAGLKQEDLHLENFLLSEQQLYAIDGDAISVRDKNQGLDLKASSSNLALFFAQFLPRYDPLLETAALHYAEQRNMSGSQLLDQLKLDLPEARSRRRHKYVAKCYRTCSEFVRLQGKGQVSVSRRDLQGESLHRILAEPDTFVRNGTLLKAGNTSTVVRVQLDGCDWVIKRYNIKGPLHALRRFLRPTRAWVSWGNAHHLKISGIATPRAIAVIEKRIGPFRSTGYYVSDFVAAVNAEDFFNDDTVGGPVKEQVAENFVGLFDLLHKLKISHGDCKATNFLIKGDQLWVLDLDAMKACSSAARFKKLFKLDRQRFMRNWQSQPVLLQWFDDRLPGK